MIKWPSIEQYKNAIHNVRHKARYRGRDENGEPIIDHGAPLPKIKYRGTVKLHGTNAGIVCDYAEGDLTFQSRERELTLTQDNAGFMLYMSHESREDVLYDLFECIGENFEEQFDHPIKDIAIFGEWCGKGIQKGVAISEVEKMFVIFGAKVEYFEDGLEEVQSYWVPEDIVTLLCAEDERIFNIYHFPLYEVEIDFQYPEIAQAEMVKITEAVEAECPVGKHFGVSGIGEGVVWRPLDSRFVGADYWFKVKGEKHSVSKVKTLAPVDVEAANSLQEFVARVVTPARLEQGIQWLQNEALLPLEMKSMGDFIRWVFNDIMKEEMDTIVASQIDPKKLGGPIANASRPFFAQAVNTRLAA